MKKNGSTLRFGLNYTPSQTWYYVWNDWDREMVVRDFQAMQAMGVDHVRVQLIWPWFQPNPTFVSPGHLRRLKELMQIAADAGMDVLLCLLTGWLSGYRFLPPQVTGKDVFTNPNVATAERLFLRRVAETVADLPNLMGFDLGNEINCLNHDLPAAEGDLWADGILRVLRELPGNTWVVNGVDHSPWMSGSTFSPDHLANAYDLVTLHCWPRFTGCLRRGKLSDLASVHLTAFFCHWARFFCRRPGLPLWVQEFGCSDGWGTEPERETYLRQGIELGIRAGVSLFTLWCSHDKTRDIEFEPDEYHYGLLTPDNKPKFLAGVYREIVQAYRGRAVVTDPLPDADCLIALPDTFSPRRSPEEGKTGDWIEENFVKDFWKVYPLYLEQVSAGRRPILVRESSLTARALDERTHVVRAAPHLG
jgi:endo-1,4-beta-mannosidase